MKSGIIRKTTSYIMGIPMNDLDIDTPQFIYDRISASEEFELKEVSFDDRNICPLVTVGYRDMEFTVGLRIEPVNAIGPDFMFSHPVPDECMKKIKQSQVGLTTIMYFNDDILASHHFQLKLLNCIIPETAAVVDFNTRRIFSPVWLKQTAASSAAPGPAYIYSINISADKENSRDGINHAWVFTQGLNRCGFVELEVINADEKNIDFFATAISIASNKAISERVFPAEMEPFDIAVLDDDRKLSVSWRNWKGEMSVYPAGTLGTGTRRPDSLNMHSGILFICPDGGLTRKPVRAVDAEPFSLDNAVIEYSEEEVKRMTALASETLPHFIKGFTFPGARGIVKVKVNAGTAEDGNEKYEYVWAEVENADNKNVYCRAVHSTLFSEKLAADERFQTELENISDWLLNINGQRVAPDCAFLVDLR